jgi:WD40 repeat protein
VLQCGDPVSECTGHTGPVTQINFLPRSASAAAGLGRVPLLLTGSEDWTARVWDAETGACRGACIGHGGAVTAMQTVHSNNATRFVTGAADGSIGLWGLDGDMVSLVQQHEQPVLLLKQGVDTLVSGGHVLDPRGVAGTSILLWHPCCCVVHEHTPNLLLAAATMLCWLVRNPSSLTESHKLTSLNCVGVLYCDVTQVLQTRHAVCGAWRASFPAAVAAAAMA